MEVRFQGLIVDNLKIYDDKPSETKYFFAVRQAACFYSSYIVNI